jgi:diguanylate cyclase (GGDEF)-like protein
MALPTKNPDRPQTSGETSAELRRRLSEVSAELAEAKRRLEEASLSDELTGLPNLRGFVLLAERQRKMTRRNFQTASVIHCDVDGLERLIETHGASAGDAMMVAAAGVLHSTFREEDLVACVDGVRFAIFATTPPEKVQAVRGRLAEACAQLDAERTDLPGPLSLSYGFASVSPSDERPLETLLALAYERRNEDPREHAA